MIDFLEEYADIPRPSSIEKSRSEKALGRKNAILSIFRSSNIPIIDAPGIRAADHLVRSQV
ncbi:MAG: hypothetical protein ISN28_06665 [Ectothiorhodospiraceae bacterium AqS1]|nr:hypothetical protein [Ectothiorhodospiraceae bacterium AqS1]